MEQKKQNFEQSMILSQLKQSFHAICVTLLSLLLPLSYLLLSRLISSPPPFFTLNSIILYILISFLSLSSLLSSFTNYTLHTKLPNCIAWAFLCLFQFCITFGIESTITSGFQPSNIGSIDHVSWLMRTLLFVGIYEQMLLWKTRFVKQLVDDAIFVEERKEGGLEMFLMGLFFSGLRLLLLQREIEPLVLALRRGGLRNGVGCREFIHWVVIFATLITGFVRIVEFVLWQICVMLQFVFCRVGQEVDDFMLGDDVV